MSIKPLLIGLFLAVPLTSFADDNACTIATKGDSLVAQACKKGGRKEAAATMKSLVNAAKAKGTPFKCGACHEDLDTYVLKTTASEDFKKLLAVAK
jgi:hypothetical protein